MNGNRTRGMGGSFILILLLLGLVMWISGMRSSETGYNWNDFMADYEADQISSAVIKPNAEVPTGSVIFTMKDGSSKELFVSDVTVVEEYMHQKNVEVVMHDMPSENWFLYYVLPILIVFIVFVFFFSLMNAQANGGGGASNKMMNFGKSRARMTTGGDVQITLKDVAGLKEEKEELEEIVEFLKNPGKFTKVGARVPKGVLLEGPPGTGKTMLERRSPGKQMFRFSPFRDLILWKCLSVSAHPVSEICLKMRRKTIRVSYLSTRSMLLQDSVEPVWEAVMMKENRR